MSALEEYEVRVVVGDGTDDDDDEKDTAAQKKLLVKNVQSAATEFFNAKTSTQMPIISLA